MIYVLLMFFVIGGCLYLMEKTLKPRQGVQKVSKYDSNGNLQDLSVFDRVFRCPTYGLGRKFPEIAKQYVIKK